MAKAYQMDAIDRKIVNALQDDAARSIQQIADLVGLSSNPCWRRIRLMEEAGIILRRVAVVDAAAIGLPTTAFVFIRTQRHDAAWLAKFAEAVAAIPEIIECHRLSGSIDYMLKCVVRDIGHYDRIYRALIARVPDLADVSSGFSMESLKRGGKVDAGTAL